MILQNQTAHCLVDGSSSLKLLSWEPEIDLDQGLEETVEWYVRQK